MSQDSHSPKTHMLDTSSTQNITQSKTPRSKWVRFIGIGCLVTVLCIGVGVATILFSGVLKGPKGNQDETPAWSPDGSQIAFVSNRDGNSDIYVMNTDGSHVMQLTQDPFAKLYFTNSPTDDFPSWSPDSKHIIFVSSRDDAMMSYTSRDIFVMNVDGSNSVRLSTGDVAFSPIFSPDGKQIAYSKDDMFPTNNNPTSGIWLMNANGSNVVQLTTDPTLEQGPSWSPDSQRIVYCSTRNGNWDLYVMNADGSNVLQLTNDSTNEGTPAWSPDGSYISYVSDQNGKLAIFVMNADGTNKVQLTDNQTNAYKPSWSPDGSRIAFASDRDGDTDIYIMNADGSNVMQLTGK